MHIRKKIKYVHVFQRKYRTYLCILFSEDVYCVFVLCTYSMYLGDVNVITYLHQ
jgi:hypothetical protein